jgi:predicted NBD/HSP70 family sugar kinase
MRNHGNNTAAVDQLRKRTANRSAILREIHFVGPMQRVELSRRLSIRKSSITSIAAELVDRGLMAEEAPDSLRRRLSLSPEGRSVLVARLGVGEIQVARVVLDGTVGGMRRVPFAANAPVGAILGLLAATLGEELERSRVGLMGIGVADIGAVDPVHGVTLFSANLPQWKNVRVRQALEDALDVGVHVDSDVRSQLWATAWFDRHLRDCRDMLYVGLQDGVAGAMIVDGRMIAGRSFSAGEFGHVRAGSEGRLCSCGKSDCLETYCSIPAVIGELRRVRPDLPADLTAGAIAALAADDRVVLNVLDRLADRLAGVLATILSAFDPDALVLGTPDAALSRVLGGLLRRRLEVELTGLGSQQVRLIVAGADATATLRGIGGLVIERCFQSGNLELGAHGGSSAEPPDGPADW